MPQFARHFPRWALISFVRWGVIVAVGAAASPAGADPLEWSAFFGADKLPKTIALGGAIEPEQRPLTGPMLGGRIAYLRGNHWVSLGFEGEATLTTSWTGYGFDQRRQSYFAPVAGYRIAAMLRLFPEWPVEPHVLGGAGGASLIGSYSPYMHAEMTGVYFCGAGVTVPVGGWLVRVDGRELWMPVLGGSREASWELQLGIGRSFGPPRTREVQGIDERPVLPPALPPPVVVTPPPAPPEPDDHVDVEMPVTTPTRPPAPPAPALPPAADAAFEAASTARFDVGKARLSTAGKLSLQKLAGVLRDHPDVKITITGHDADAALAKKRAEAVKWYLVDQGAAQDQIDTQAGDAANTSITVAPR